MQALFWEGDINDYFVGHQMAEVYKDKVYEPFLSGSENLVILDIGANIGVTSHYFSQFADKVYAIEPSADHFKILQKMTKYNKLDNVEPINKAVALKTGELEFYHNDNKTMFSLRPEVKNDEEPEKVEAVSFDDLFDELNLDHVDFVKLDVEGSEVELVSGTGFKKVADRIDFMVIEYHTWSGRHPNQLVDALKLRGFGVGKIPNDANLFIAKRI